MNRIIAVVVTYNRPDKLKLNISALCSQTQPLSHIIVVDNASAVPAQFFLPPLSNLTIYRNKTNLGGAGGFAVGVQIALKMSSEWIWLMDDDAIPQPDALLELNKIALHVPLNIGAICSAVYENYKIAYKHRRYYDVSLGIEKIIPQRLYDLPFIEIDTGSFVGFLLRSKAASIAGEPDAEFFISYDDTEYSLRLKSLGYSILLAPFSKIDHLVTEGSYLRNIKFGHRHYYNIRNRIIVSRRYTKIKILSCALAIMSGFVIFFRSKESMNQKSIYLCFKAFKDGCCEKLGAIP